jgi:hypothetical protein
MARKTAIQVMAVLAVLAAGDRADAIPYSSFEPRSYAMGGVGVAAGAGPGAVFLNPGLLTVVPAGEDVSLEFPVMGVRVADPDELSDSIDEFNDVEPVGTFQNAVNAYLATPNAGTAATVQTAGDTLIDQLRNISAKTLSAEADVGVVVGIPHDKYGVAVLADVDVLGGAVGDATAADLAAIQQTIDDAVNAQPVTDPTAALTSSVNVRFSRVTQIGLAVAREFDILGGISVGVTPKLIEVRTYDFRFTGSQIDTAEVSLSKSQQNDVGVNLDVGAAKAFGDNWKVGLAVRNLIPQNYETVLDNDFKLEPMARLGVAYRNSSLTLSSDLDLTENDSGGFEPKTRYAAIGAELYLFEAMQIRLGYRHNLSDIPTGFEPNIMTAGLGMTPFGVDLDLAVAGNGNELGVAMKLGFRF